MKKKLLFVLPALVGMLMVGCTTTKPDDGGGETRGEPSAAARNNPEEIHGSHSPDEKRGKLRSAGQAG